MSRNGLRCPTCGTDDLTVLESRMEQNGTRRRVRMCLKCGEKITTHEIADIDLPTVRAHQAQTIINRARAMLEKAMAALEQAEQGKPTDLNKKTDATDQKGT